jgi:hypothetical protein
MLAVKTYLGMHRRLDPVIRLRGHGARGSDVGRLDTLQGRRQDAERALADDALFVRLLLLLNVHHPGLAARGRYLLDTLDLLLRR